MRLPAAEPRRAPRRGPRAGPSISTASLPVTQHPPPALLLPPAPGDRRHHSAGRGAQAPREAGSPWGQRPRAAGMLPGRRKRLQSFHAPASGEVCSGNTGLRPRHVVGSSPRPFPAATGVFQTGPRWEKRPRCFLLLATPPSSPPGGDGQGWTLCFNPSPRVFWFFFWHRGIFTLVPCRSPPSQSCDG